MVYRPENIINLYVWEQLKLKYPDLANAYAQVSGGQQIVPFFPAPANNVPAFITENDLPHFVFDKFMRVRSGYKSVYSVKTDQMRLTVIGGGLEYNTANRYQDRYGKVIDYTSFIQKVLDREDATAQDINQFAGTLPNYNNSDAMDKYYFHNFSVYQSGYTETQQDVADFMDYNPTRDLIIRYDYHSKQYNES